MLFTEFKSAYSCSCESMNISYNVKYMKNKCAFISDSFVYRSIILSNKFQKFSQVAALNCHALEKKLMH